MCRRIQECKGLPPISYMHTLHLWNFWQLDWDIIKESWMDIYPSTSLGPSPKPHQPQNSTGPAHHL